MVVATFLSVTAGMILLAVPASAVAVAIVTDSGGGTEQTGAAFTITAVVPGADVTNDPGYISWVDVDNLSHDLSGGDLLPTPPVSSACTYSAPNTTCTLPGVVLSPAGTHNVTVNIGTGATGTRAVNVTSTSVCSITGPAQGGSQSASPGSFFALSLQVTVTCSHGVAPAGQKVTFTASNSNVSPSSITATVGPDGIAQAAFEAVSGGTSTVTASYPGSTSVPFSLTVVGGAGAGSDFPDCHLYGVSGGNQSTPESDFFPQAVTATLRCASTDVGGQQVTFSEVGGTGTDLTFTPSNVVTTDPDGVALVAVRAGSSSGTFYLRASYPGTIIEYAMFVTGGTLTQPFLGCSLTSKSGDNQNASQGAPFVHALSVTLSGCFTTPVGGQQVTFTQTGGSGTVSFNGGTPAAVTTGPDGVASVVATAGNGGPVTVTASYAAGASTETFTLYSIAPGVSQAGCTIAGGPATISGGGQYAAVGASFTQPISVTVDCTAAGISPLGQQVTFAETSPGVHDVTFTSGGVGSADGTGRAQVTVNAAGTAPSSNPVTVTATYGASTQTFTLYITGGPTPIPNCSVVTSSMSGYGQTAEAGHPFAEPLAETLTCGSLSPANQYMQFREYQGTGDLTFGPSSGVVFSDASGRIQVSVYASSNPSRGDPAVGAYDGTGRLMGIWTLWINSPGVPQVDCTLGSPQGDGQYAPENTFFSHSVQVTLSCVGPSFPVPVIPPLPQGQTVTFSVYSGSGSIASNPTVPVGADGKVSASIRAGPSAGPLVIKASYGPGAGQAYYFNLRVA